MSVNRILLVQNHVDLHMHSTASDGTLTPSALMEQAKADGMRIVALTDHDTCSGAAEAARAAAGFGMCFIPGIELSCGGAREIHVLGYGIDPENPGLMSFREKRMEERRLRAIAMMDALEAAGAAVDRTYVNSLVNGFIGRPHIARGLVQAGHVHTVEEAFDRFLVPGRPGYVPRPEVTVAEGCSLIRAAGGVPVLAHPMELRSGESALSSLVHEWCGQGLAGMEIYHPSTANHKAAMLRSIARQEKLLVTGGSDFHGPQVRPIRIGQGVERWETAEMDLKRLFDAMGREFPAELFLQ
ncbi:MAG: PHP domain-containing protein [Clostridia bacterium]|nr:PHP domain-containing protein [Clostridia bacterium]